MTTRSSALQPARRHRGLAQATRACVGAFALALAVLANGCANGSEPTRPQVVATVQVQPAQHILAVGDEVALTASARDESGDEVVNPALVWSSSDEAIARVTPAGRVQALAPGAVRILATVGGKIGAADLTVTTAPVASIVVSPTAILLEVGQSRILTAVTKDSRGNVLEGREVAWTVDGASVSVSPDGVLVGRSPGYATVIASSEGKTFGVGVTVVLTGPASHDLLYRRRGDQDVSDILTIPIGSPSAPVLVRAGLPSSHPTASPDGDRIAFAVSEFSVLSDQNALVSSLYVVDRDGTNIKRLTRGIGSEDQPAWSPVGALIAYRYIGPDGRADIWVMNTDGSNARNLTADLPADTERRSPAWSADGTRIAFASQQSGIEDVVSSIWTMRADGTDKRMLTKTLTGYDAWPTWSPDGRRIAFIRQYDLEGDIAIVDANGGEPTRVSLLGRQLTPSWSPDGESIAFVQPGVGGLNVYTVSPAGTNLRLRTVDPSWGGGVEPTWIRKR